MERFFLMLFILKLIVVMNMHVIPVHKQYIKDFSVLSWFHDPSVITQKDKNRPLSRWKWI